MFSSVTLVELVSHSLRFGKANKSKGTWKNSQPAQTRYCRIKVQVEDNHFTEPPECDENSSKANVPISSLLPSGLAGQGMSWRPHKQDKDVPLVPSSEPFPHFFSFSDENTQEEELCLTQ
jgi:hypothetical protein